RAPVPDAVVQRRSRVPDQHGAAAVGFVGDRGTPPLLLTGVAEILRWYATDVDGDRGPRRSVPDGSADVPVVGDADHDRFIALGRGGRGHGDVLAAVRDFRALRAVTRQVPRAIL